jgi:hypothetical protein
LTASGYSIPQFWIPAYAGMTASKSFPSSGIQYMQSLITLTKYHDTSPAIGDSFLL